MTSHVEEQLLRLLLLVVIVVTRAEGSEPEHVYIPDNIDDADSEPRLPDGFDLGSMGSLRGHWFKDPAIQFTVIVSLVLITLFLSLLVLCAWKRYGTSITLLYETEFSASPERPRQADIESKKAK